MKSLLIPSRRTFLRSRFASSRLPFGMLRQRGSFQAGLTIIECLIAILIVSILMTAIAPAMTFSVATRVQARRVELATQAARTYIDGLKSGAIAPPKHTASPPFATNAAAPSTSGSLTCINSTYCMNTSTSSLYCLSLDIADDGCSSSSFQDLVIQAFRTDNIQNYLLGLRVYRADAFSDSTSLVASSQNNKSTQVTFAAGIGDRKAPLIEMMTEISTAQPRLQDLCERLGGCD